MSNFNDKPTKYYMVRSFQKTEVDADLDCIETIERVELPTCSVTFITLTYPQTWKEIRKILGGEVGELRAINSPAALPEFEDIFHKVVAGALRRLLAKGQLKVVNENLNKLDKQYAKRSGGGAGAGKKKMVDSSDY